MTPGWGLLLLQKSQRPNPRSPTVNRPKAGGLATTAIHDRP